MSKRVLVTAPYMQPVIERFRERLEAQGIELVVPPVKERMNEAELLEWIDGIDGVISGDDQFTERVLAAASKLKVISKWGTGIDSIDQKACRQLGIAIRNTPNAFSQAVADSVLGYILCFARRLPWMSEAVKRGEWCKIPGRALHECTLGVIGVGNVGKQVVRRANAFGIRVLGNDVGPTSWSLLESANMMPIGLDELLGRSDFVSLNCDLNPTSYHLMNEERLAQMRADAVLVNTARGTIVDESALVRALEHGQIAGAALDVFEDEPLPQDSPLRAMDNVMLASHNANSSPAAWERVHRSTIDNLLAELGVEQP